VGRVNAAGVMIGSNSVGLPAPADQWPPNPGVLFDTRVAIMEAVMAGLEAHARLHPVYERRILGHGIQTQVMPGVSGQIIVTLLGVLPGIAGQQQFQFPSGDFGAVASSGRRFARYRVLVLRAWRSLNKEGMGAGVPSASDYAKQTQDVDTDGELCWAALTALGLGGLTTTVPKAPVTQNNTLLASMLAWGPQGGQAGWEYVVEQQL
jgi:hypothetical protein